MIIPILAKIKEYSVIKKDKIACKFSDDCISYYELERETNIIAYKIHRLLKKKQEPIIIYQKRNPQFVKYMISVLKCGCYYIPLEHNVPAERVKYIYNDINAKLIITDKQASFDSNKYNLAFFEEIENVSNDISLNIELHPSDLVYVMYTSGTAGKPKGVKITHSNLANLIEAFYPIVYRNFEEDISVGVLSSFSFDASVKQIYCSLYYGHKLCIAENGTRNFGRKIHTFHIENKLSICDATPSHINLMAMQNTKNTSDIPYILIGGELLRWETLHKYIQFTSCMTTFINVYGPTECCVDAAYKIISEEDLDKHLTGIVPIGKSIINTELTIRSEAGFIIDDFDKEGELFISGKQVGLGYVNVSTDAFIKEGDLTLYKTGDIAYRNSENDIVVIGRKDTQIKMNGYRIELNEIQVLIENYMKCFCAVVFMEQAIGGKIIAFICNTQLDEGAKNDLKDYLSHVLPGYMLPNHYTFISSLPLSNNGKLDNEKLKHLYETSIEKSDQKRRLNELLF